jgi:hypothetical protein
MIRVFPRQTKWTPDDELSFVGEPPLPQFRPADPTMPVFVSCTFTWDVAYAERLAASWRRFYRRVELGGPAFGDAGNEFVAGRFLKQGVTITSRGCPRHCPWCVVPRREGVIRELSIVPGYIVQDNNLLACSERHLDAVFAMLCEQKRGAVFSGGLDARLFDSLTLHRLEQIRVAELWFALDSNATWPSLRRVANWCSGVFSIEKMRCYVLIGYPGDSLTESRQRLEDVYALGFLPFAQLYRGDLATTYSADWRALARKWSRPAAYRQPGSTAATVGVGRTR